MSPTPPSANAAMLGRIEAAIMAESALVDKESGRVYWEGGDSSTLSASLYPKIGVPGFSHLKTTVLTSLLLLALVSFLAQWIRQRLDTQQPTTASVESIKSPLYKSIALFVLQWTLLKTPKFEGAFVICVFLLYLLEAYSCSTRRYLANAITSPKEVEEYIERLRNEEPVVTWKVRCFHYEKPFWLSPLKSAQAVSKLFQRKNTKSIEDVNAENVTPVIQKDDENDAGIFRRKVISHQATANYTFSRFVDATIAGVWKRQAAISNEAAPFMKIVLSKILLLANQDAKNDYFKQQSQFVTEEGMRDRYAEYSTNIEVAGFKRRMLAIRPVQGVPSAKIFRLNTFWIFSLLGLSLPYRIWFAHHCENLKVTVVKETYAQAAAGKSSFSSWFYSSKPAPPVSPETKGTSQGLFRQQMQGLLLYAQQEDEHQSTLNSLAAVDDKPIPLPQPTPEGFDDLRAAQQDSADTQMPEAGSSELSSGQQTAPSTSQPTAEMSLGNTTTARDLGSSAVDTATVEPALADANTSDTSTSSSSSLSEAKPGGQDSQPEKRIDNQ